MVNRRVRHAVTAIAAGVLTVPLCAAAAAGASPTRHQSVPVVVVTGLNNPRQLSLVDGVELLIAELIKQGFKAKKSGG